MSNDSTQTAPHAPKVPALTQAQEAFPLNLLETLVLERGSHPPDDGVCAMELAARLAGEPHGDRPECVCPVIGAFVRNWNDSLDDADRNRLLKPLIPRLIGTRSTPKVEARRAWLAADWLVRECTPAWLRAANLKEEAESLVNCVELCSMETAQQAMPALNQAKTSAAAAGAAAEDAAEDAAGAAAEDAAEDAAGAAAGAAAEDAAGAAAGAAAEDAAEDAAWAAACAARAATWATARAARAATWDALQPTVNELQLSAVRLLERMIECKED